jgi:glycine/D-amino acid oxidase-like deaminating enzyme
LLSKAGKSVVLVEKSKLCRAETGHTTAHISYPCDTRLTDLISTFGETHAQAIWDAGLAAAQQLASIVSAELLDCDLRYVPGYLYAAGDDDVAKEAERLRAEADKGSELGFDTRFIDPFPVTEQPSLAFANLMKFHPLRYATGLAKAAVGSQCQIFENSEVKEFAEDGKSATCNGHTITFKHVFVATHVPLQGAANLLGASHLQTKLAGYSTYAIGAWLPDQAAPEALWWDTADPYLYLHLDVC